MIYAVHSQFRKYACEYVISLEGTRMQWNDVDSPALVLLVLAKIIRMPPKNLLPHRRVQSHIRDGILEEQEWARRIQDQACVAIGR